MVDVRAPDLDVAGPPAHLLLDHPGAGADKGECAEQGDEEQKGSETAGVDDLAMELALDARDQQGHDEQAIGARGRLLK